MLQVACRNLVVTRTLNRMWHPRGTATTTKVGLSDAICFYSQSNERGRSPAGCQAWYNPLKEIVVLNGLTAENVIAPSGKKTRT